MTKQPPKEVGLQTIVCAVDFSSASTRALDYAVSWASKSRARLVLVHALEAGSAIVIPAGVEHNVVNTSSATPLRLYTLYSPPEHPDGTVQHTKEEAAAGAHH